MVTTVKTLDDLKGEDVFDSRDLIERIADLESELADAHDDNETDDVLDMRAELATLQAFAEEARGYVPDFIYGESFISEDYFTTYAQDYADEVGAIDSRASWPLTFIDWPAAAAALQQDYTSFDLDGVTFWARS